MNNIYINTNLISNFKPNNIFLKLNNQLKTKKIYCKNFFIYLLLLKYNCNFYKKSTFFIKKQKKKVFTILRSPYRHKLARHQIYLNRYFIKNSIIFEQKSLIVKNFKKIIYLTRKVKKINSIFESNIIYTNNIKISVPIIFSENFKIKNYLKL